LIKVEVRDIRKKILKMMTMAIALNPNLIDIIYSKEIHNELLEICLKDDISVNFNIKN